MKGTCILGFETLGPCTIIGTPIQPAASMGYHSEPCRTPNGLGIKEIGGGGGGGDVTLREGLESTNLFPAMAGYCG